VLPSLRRGCTPTHHRHPQWSLRCVLLLGEDTRDLHGPLIVITTIEDNAGLPGQCFSPLRTSQHLQSSNRYSWLIFRDLDRNCLPRLKSVEYLKRREARLYIRRIESFCNTSMAWPINTPYLQAGAGLPSSPCSGYYQPELLFAGNGLML